MTSSGIVRWGAIGFMLGGVIWLVLGLSALVGYLQAIPGREDVVLFVAAMLLTATGLVGLHTLQRGSHGRLGLAGLCIALAAITAHVLAAVLYLAGNPAFQWLSSPVGRFGMLIGLVLYGIATLRARVLPRWYGLTLAVSMPVSLGLGHLLAAYWSSLLFGLFFLVLGYAFRSRRSTAAEGASRVS
ncbi:MAG TPA: hypothetical protein VGW38_15915 [Chloroflexota bacterium]|nr:hypothetical protein [Chloroflexota bacterium]